jgi:hypothetical protein
MADDHRSVDPITTDPLSRDLPPETAGQAKVDERNWFYESLAPEAKERFLEALAAAQERGLGEDAAWREAVLAAETTYPPEPMVPLEGAPDGPGDVDEPL